MNSKENKTAREKWQELGILKKQRRKALDLSFGNMILLVNWSTDWTWASIEENGNLRHIVIGFTKTQKIGRSGDILNVYSIFCLKLVMAFGFLKKK